MGDYQRQFGGEFLNDSTFTQQKKSNLFIYFFVHHFPTWVYILQQIRKLSGWHICSLLLSATRGHFQYLRYESNQSVIHCIFFNPSRSVSLCFYPPNPPRSLNYSQQNESQLDDTFRDLTSGKINGERVTDTSVFCGLWGGWGGGFVCVYVYLTTGSLTSTPLITGSILRCIFVPPGLLVMEKIVSHAALWTSRYACFSFGDCTSHLSG